MGANCNGQGSSVLACLCLGTSRCVCRYTSRAHGFLPASMQPISWSTVATIVKTRRVCFAPPQSGETALLQAACRGDVRMVALLLSRGADAEALDAVRSGNTWIPQESVAAWLARWIALYG